MCASRRRDVAAERAQARFGSELVTEFAERLKRINACTVADNGYCG
jgi:hypothetical protein